MSERRFLLEVVMGNLEAGGYLTPSGPVWHATFADEVEAKVGYEQAKDNKLCLAAMLIEWTSKEPLHLPHHSYAIRNCSLGAAERVLSHGSRRWASFNAGRQHAYVAKTWNEGVPPDKVKSPGAGGAWSLKALPQSESAEVIERLPEYPWTKLSPDWLDVTDGVR